MEEKIIQLHAEICKCLASPVRLKVLNVLRKGEKSVDVLARILGVQKANLSQHLGILRQRKIVTTRKSGLNIFYSISNPKMLKACDILREILFEQLQESEKLIKGMTKKKQGEEK
ncbi:MAG: hypothetical protein A2Z91_07920 [Deltaproteobacteria bacterium GWA2_38_16]|nr:MAG: hypothetical protein A2Z91_07920 [Deltaproteobacteria bacterium GWA2_38_16]OGQ03370.1 MAG: hypothetical protein A3D19_04540 [Deltaproteobacteria bacterium RIFCSPHIGHO2_02_FULL_38_15]OGQ33922.1 MAG: hypothetical protein A3A72_03950 [Deltaproteobacteria bacterium RIFCSPLOWO2_01_FULL_38_9]OGQ59542.1 MAG: hypothetical protein A3G92_04540 [Deltaproteobacteria bacterium RIFCSPLOWO2_12_FULL_38_8]HBQ20644.1 transcriptional regulator [Deltaproteobacteria bacterium]